MSKVRKNHRRWLVLAHRWMGLGITVFLVILGITGSLIAFNDELEAWISPQLFRVAPPFEGAPFLDPLALREQVLARYPEAQVDWVELAPRAGSSLFFGLDPKSGAFRALDNDQVFLDPYTGRVLGERLQGDLRQGWKNFMPFVYALHTSLALGDVGTVVLGVAALLWSIDCFVGFYLTLPMKRAAPPSRPLRLRWRHWLSRWAPAWQWRWGASVPKLLFDLHRAGGLWAWAMLLVLAWSGVGFNLPQVYQPVMRTVFGYVAPEHGKPAKPAHATGQLPLNWVQARQAARVAMQEAAIRHQFKVRRERLLHHDADRGIYEYRVLSTLDVGDKLGNTTLFIDDQTGAMLRIELPTGQHAGNTVDTWLSSIHTASWGGLAMQAGLCLAGMATVMVSCTGVWIWWRRRHARRRSNP